MSSNHNSAHGSLRSYSVGLILSIILTVIPFYMVMNHSLSSSGALIAVIFILAVVQIVVQAVYFLHLSKDAEGGWNMLTMWFTLMTVGIVVIGSIWIMFHLHMNTMS
ncbi:cytochrome o ubiquinol oxidase subunit IV [Carnimonas bestiolae]|uniref:cytochrome o ubiquinol oxidase subunit IV n=1 Tax=Carnimonas bestiolae TaxID=3402172 RepID=UPI003EDC17F3